MMDSSRPPWLPLGSLLVRERLITTEQLEVALLEQQQLNWRLGEILVNWGWVTSREIAFALAEQYGLGFLDLTNYPFVLREREQRLAEVEMHVDRLALRVAIVRKVRQRL